MHDQARIQDETVGGYLDRLAARLPAPGGGAAAALHAAQGAALLGMVARYTTGEKYAAQAEAVARITAESDELRGAALDLAAADAAAFTAVTDAYALPRGGDGEKAARSAAIAAALAGAARPPADVIGVARRIIALAEELLPIGNPNVVTDVAAAAEAARAAATTARVNVEINLAGIKSPATRAALTAATSDVDPLAARAAALTSAVRQSLQG
ncbi:cyclodeaminase/cyclohydrolase family protein [Actinacidiphila bryophytorum]|uniref:Formiminotetrahydrofolate cyclodeaminase n=1 Tax=Actinacidiphila bryophytorum TaxID=1436133 RepID=A0A9W4E259_9ACTN|nr:cyclodeaminase/cyclohydrolase family protein [Actinacidiphila bryophytorum]CAG7596947.1 Formiminotetrahydrofolate cyclodeaminase [Actinacidiphila bryophytorum]